MQASVKYVKPESCSDMGDATYPIKINGNEYPLKQLTLNDYADLQAFLKAESFAALFEGAMKCRGLSPEALGKAMGQVAGRSFTLFEQTDDQAGRMRMLWLSLKRGGSTETWEQFRDTAKVDVMTGLFEVLMWISDTPVVKGVDSNRPTTDESPPKSKNGETA